MITSKGLEYFYLVEALGSIRAASLKLRISPSAISRQISLLEEDGLELGVRHARGLHLTEAGQILYSHVRETRLQEENLKETLAAMRGLKKGSVSIIAGDGFGHDLITNVLPTFRQNYPQIEVGLSFGGTDHIMQSIGDEEGDIGLAYGADIPSGIRCLKSIRQPMVVAYSKAGHRVMRESGLSLLLKEDIALPPISSGSRQVLEQALAFSKLETKSSVTIPTVDGLLAYVIACNGYAVVPKFSVMEPRYSAAIGHVPIDLESVGRAEVSLIVRADRRLPPAAVEMATHIEARLSVFALSEASENYKSASNRDEITASHFSVGSPSLGPLAITPTTFPLNKTGPPLIPENVPPSSTITLFESGSDPSSVVLENRVILASDIVTASSFRLPGNPAS